MNQAFILGRLADLMGWEASRYNTEFRWLLLMSRMKYDGYQDFLAGMRFIESLADWLQQFQAEEREAAYSFVRNHLVFVGPSEMRHLVELFYPEKIQPRLIQSVAAACNIPPYRIWANGEATKLYDTLLRKTLFIELSDGARIDIFRRVNAGIINNEQIVTAPRIHKAKWDDLLKDLRKATGKGDDRFAFVFLVDDFSGSGMTLLRQEEGVWKGKLVRFWDDMQEIGGLGNYLEQDWRLCVHHYLCTYQADTDVKDRDQAIRSERGDGKWFNVVEFSSGMTLTADCSIRMQDHPEFALLVQKYYDNSIADDHMKKGGDDARLGFGKCALPLILEHNTPNNSIALLWAETNGENQQHAMRPLFRRRKRHT